MFPPYSMVNIGVDKKYKKWNLEYIKNSPEDILYATEEMIDELNNNNFNYLHKNQKEIQNQSQC